MIRAGVMYLIDDITDLVIRCYDRIASCLPESDDDWTTGGPLDGVAT